MPIHDFGSFKKIEDAEKEVEEGKAQEIKVGQDQDKAYKPDIDKPRVPKEDNNAREERKQKTPKKVGKKEIKEASHPLIHGTLEIEEEDL